MLPRYWQIDAASLHHLPASSRHPADTFFHFSFAHYYDPQRLHFGVLQVLNDDEVQPRQGFGRHPHRDMEIVSYVVAGRLTHWDSATGVEESLGRGEVQAISAGTGVWHSEWNHGDEPCRFLQIWIAPAASGRPVRYGNRRFAAGERRNRLLPLVGPVGSGFPLEINQDARLFAAELTDLDARVSFSLAPGRQAYITNMEGCLDIPGLATLWEREALEMVGPAAVEFTAAGETAHFLIIEMEAG